MTKTNTNIKTRAYAKQLKSRANARRVAAEKLVVELSDKVDELSVKVTGLNTTMRNFMEGLIGESVKRGVDQAARGEFAEPPDEIEVAEGTA